VPEGQGSIILAEYDLDNNMVIVNLLVSGVDWKITVKSRIEISTSVVPDFFNIVFLDKTSSSVNELGLFSSVGEN
jgi:hypothetical protein